MDAVAISAIPAGIVPEPAAAPVHAADQLAEFLLPALRTALRDSAEHRLYQTGKLPGLFASRYGTPAAAARFAIDAALLDVVRTETKGRQAVEWVRPTPRAVRFVEERDSPRAVLAELRDAIGQTRAGVPVWLANATAELDALRAAFDARARQFAEKLDDLTRRVEAALRRTELNPPGLSASAARMVPWGLAALEYLDRRAFTGVPGDCPLAELFRATADAVPDLTLADFHSGIRRLHDLRAVKLVPGPSADTEFGLVMGAEVCSAVRR